MLIECNYEIYDKKLLIIIRCLKHRRFELKFTNISMKIFNNHKILKIFMTNKNFIRRQIREIKIFFQYNFKIMYQFDSRNVKTNVFTRFFETMSKNENDVRIKQQHQMIIISNRLKIRIMKMNSNLSLYVRIIKINKINDEWFEYRIVLIQKKFKNVKLIICTIKHEMLYYDNRVKIFNDVQFFVHFIRKSYDLFMCDHSNVKRILKIIDRYYY